MGFPRKLEAWPRGGLRWLAITVGLFVLSLGAVSACGSDQAYLAALRADPMAGYEAEGIELVGSWEQEEGRTLGKPVHARVERLYRVVDSSETDRVLEEAADFAESAGWRLQRSSIAPDRGYRGAKALEPGDARLVVSVGAFTRSQSEQNLRIVLDFGVAFLEESTSG